MKPREDVGCLYVESGGRVSWTATRLWLPAGAEPYTGDIVLGGASQQAVLSTSTITPSNLTIRAGAVLSHFRSSESREYRLDLNALGVVRIEADGAIDVSGRGYLAGRTLGNTTNGAATGRGGGSYGGMGGVYYTDDTVNPVYGDFRNPNELGSGGASGKSYGGGLVRLCARELVVDGVIRADGAAGGGSSPGGSGGGIYIEADRISGVGVVTVNGGNGGSSAYGGGGGGRIAIHYGEVSGMVLTNQVWAMGGSNGNSSAGTVYLKPREDVGCLYVESGGRVSWTATSLWLPAGAEPYTGDIVLGGESQHAALLTLAITPSNLTIQAGAVLRHFRSSSSSEYKLELNAGTIRIECGGAIDVSGRGYLAGRTFGNTTVGAAVDDAGGSYGGMGGTSGTDNPNAVYGDFRNPNELGSGGGSDKSYGGGLVRLRARKLTVDGAIAANGAAGGNYGPGGSGGGVYIDVDRIAGSGTIAANGGSGGSNDGAGGGGGRIAIYAADLATFDTNNVTASAGAHGNPAAQSGTVYIPAPPSSLMVAGMSPSGYRNGALSEITVECVPSVTISSLTAQDVEVRFDDRPVAVASLTAISDFAFRVALAGALESDGLVQVNVGPHILSRSGGEMDQDADGVPGEENDDVFRGSIWLDFTAPQVALPPPPATVVAGVPVTLALADIRDSNGIASVAWDFGDGQSGVGGEVSSHTYATGGAYTVTVTVTDLAGNQTTVSYDIVVASVGPVVAVPWRMLGEVDLPHPSWPGRTNIFKAVASAAPLPFTYTWGFGDGSAPFSGLVTNRNQSYTLQTTHAYTGSVGTLYTALVTVAWSESNAVTATYEVLLSDKTVVVETDAAIDDGLWYVHGTQQRTTLSSGDPAGFWTSHYSGVEYRMGVTASAVQAFKLHAHLDTGNPLRDPYAETALRGMHYLLASLTKTGISGQPGGNPDSNCNCIGITVSSDKPIYELGQVMDAICVASSTNAVASVGPAGVLGRTYRDIVRDMADTYAWGQCDTASKTGGWRYSWNAADADNSASQWGAIGLLAAEKLYDLPCVPWVKALNLRWCQYSRATSGFGYTGPTDSSYVEGTTPAALIQLAWLGVERTNSYWLAGENYIASRWNALVTSRNIYRLYAIAKAMRIANPAPVTAFAFNGLDWYGNPTNGLARVILNQQDRLTGSWTASGFVTEPQYVTPWALIILSGSVFTLPPVARIVYEPSAPLAEEPVTFDGRASYHPDPNARIVEYRWDFDAADGVDFSAPDAGGPVVTHSYPVYGVYTASLMVVDDNVPALSNVARVAVAVNIPAHPPVAQAGGPYVAAMREDIHLDGSGSFDPDAEDGDAISAWEWFDRAPTNAAVPVARGDRVIFERGFAVAGPTSLCLRVTDTTSQLFPGFPDLHGTSAASVIVYERLIDDLRARPKETKCQLTWRKRGDEAVILRSESGPNSGFVEIGRTRNGYATWLDETIVTSRRYFYRILVYEDGNPAPVGASSAAYAWSVALGSNRAPPIAATPPLAAYAGTEYRYEVAATDAEGDPIAFDLLDAPAGMCIETNTGVIVWQPAMAQLGSHEVTVLAADAGGADAQSYQLVVLPGANRAPTAAANGPYETLSGAALTFSSAGTADPDGDNLDYVWNFGDGCITNGASPSHVYARHGEYIARLFVADGRGGTASDRAIVTVKRPNQPPTLLLDANAFNVRLGRPVNVDASGSSDPDGDPLSFEWSWGDGETSSDISGRGAHVHPVVGVYPCYVTVNDGFGGVASAPFTVNVGPSNNAPAAAFAILAASTNVGDILTFDASASTDPDGDPLTFHWSFDDGRTVEGAVAMHLFKTIGEHTIGLTVRDSYGAANACARTVTIVNAHPAIVSTPPANAAVGALYEYAAEGQDPEGDPLTFALDAAPAGMTIEPADGVTRWTPQSAQTGNTEVVVRVTDPYGACGTQAFVIAVSPENRPPVADAGPDRVVLAGATVQLDGRGSFDPDNSPLSYAWSLRQHPAGAAPALSGAGDAAPTLSGADLCGDYVVRLVVNDGATSSVPDEVRVRVAATTNEPPAITSVPGGAAMVGAPYLYLPVCFDPDGDALMLALPTAPAGAAFSAGTGLQWTPTETGVGIFRLEVTDARGAVAWQSWSVNVVDYTNLPPAILSTPVQQTAPEIEYAYDIAAADPNGDALTYALIAAPSGMTIVASSGAVRWTPDAGQVGLHQVEVRVSDTHDAWAGQRFSLAVRATGHNAPAVRPLPSAVVTAPAAFDNLRLDDYVSDPDDPVSSLQWRAFGASNLTVSIDAGRVAHFSYPADLAGTESLLFMATDPAGLSGAATAAFTVKGTDRPPVAAIANLAEDPVTSVRDGLFELFGTADDPDASDAVAYRLCLFDADGALVTTVTPGPRDGEGWHTGRVPAGGSFGALDLSLLRNDVYELRLQVRSGTKIATVAAPLAIDSPLKIGQFTFSQQDITVPVSGLPLAVIRTYDSLNAASGDFGYGWTYAISEPQVRIAETRERDVDAYTFREVSIRTGGSRDITLTMPDDGRRVTFRYELKRGYAGPGIAYYQATWTAPPGVYATLAPTCSPKLIVLGAFGDPLVYWEAAGLLPSYENFDFPGFILTTRDGTQYRIARESQGEAFVGDATIVPYTGAYLAEIVVPNGQRIEFVRRSGALQNVDYYDPNGIKTRSLHFSRDAQDRIVAVYDPTQVDAQGQPQDPPAVRYTYDAAGNLTSAATLTDASDPANPVYRTVSYVYGLAGHPHYITEIRDPRGIAPLRAEYDDAGRLVATVDANGNRIVLQHDLAARTETVFDRLGQATIHAYDAQGNVVATTDPLGHTNLRTYDSCGNETSVTDPLGNTTRKSYSASGDLLSIVDPLGHTNRYTYDAKGNQLTSTDPLGHVTSNVYDRAGNPLATTDALGQVTRNRYDASGNLVEMQDTLGRTSMSLGYDAAGQLTRMTDAAGVARSFSYDGRGNQTGMTSLWVNPADSNDTRLVTTRTHYDSSGLVTNAVDPNGNVTWTRYNAIGKPEVSADKLGNITAYLYDALGNAIQTRLPNGLTSETLHDAEGRPVLSVSAHVPGLPANGTRTSYDAAGRAIRSEQLADVVIEIADPALDTRRATLVSVGAVLSSSETVYDAAGRAIEQTDAAGACTRYAYDAANRLTTTIGPMSPTSPTCPTNTYTYDAAGRRTLARDALGRETRFLYDALGRQVATLFHDGTSTSNAFDVAGNRVAEWDQSGKRRDFEYDGMGRLTSVALPKTPDPARQFLPAVPRYDYAYSAQGALLSIRDPLGRETRFAYDHLNRQTARTLPMGETEYQEYDAGGRLARKTDFKGQVTEYRYDSLGRTISIATTNALQPSAFSLKSFSYDSLGRLISVVGPTSPTSPTCPTNTYSYDTQNRLVRIATPEGTLHYDYDPATDLKTRAWTDSGTETIYGYDALGRLATVSAVQPTEEGVVTNVTTYAYNETGSRASVTLPNGVATTYAYNNLNRLTGLTHHDAAGRLLGAYGYTLAPDGRRTGAAEVQLSSFESPTSSFTNTVSYTYDVLNRLTRESLAAADDPLNPSYTSDYVYDLAGNRLARTVSAGGQILTTTYEYDANDRLIRESHNTELAALPVTSDGVYLAGGFSASDPLTGMQALGRRAASIGYRPLPSVWAYWGFRLVPLLALVALLAPFAMSLLARWGILKAWRGPPGGRRLPALYRGLAGALSVIFLVDLATFESIAQESDLYGRLKASDWGRQGSVTTYTYDANGSLIRSVCQSSDTSDTSDYTYNLQNRLVAHTRTESDGTGTTVTTTTYAYDADGHRVGSETVTTLNGEETDRSSRRFLIDAYNPTGYAQILEERDGETGDLIKSYTIGDDVLSQATPASAFSLQPSYFLYDGHGSTRQLADGAGEIVAAYAYDAYGVMLGQQAGAQARQATDLLYCGEQFDTALQQYHLRARDYNPSNGRFTSLDPYSGSPHDPQSLHKYTYCHADPVNGVDPSGEYTLTEQMMVGAITSIIGQTVSLSIRACFGGRVGTAWEEFLGMVGAGLWGALTGTVSYQMALLFKILGWSTYLTTYIANILQSGTTTLLVEWVKVLYEWVFEKKPFTVETSRSMFWAVASGVVLSGVLGYYTETPLPNSGSQTATPSYAGDGTVQWIVKYGGGFVLSENLLSSGPTIPAALAPYVEGTAEVARSLIVEWIKQGEF
ncbi:MAG: PKD domain-containing protein [Kiritimatiellae bacterium]|nr:PKD domain-containing protein [Kiritimatiellia bacterium]